MIPAEWAPYYRADDGELIGFLAEFDGTFVPMNLLGQPLDEPLAELAAEQTLEGIGLSYLADRWMLTHDDGTQERVVLVEINTERVVVTGAEFALVVGTPDDMAVTHELALPTDRLRRA